jgi:predicted dehydrogenase
LESIYSAGIIGCGFIGVEAPDSHIKAYTENKRTKLDAICDKNLIKAWQVYTQYPYAATITDKYREMLEAIKLDIVSVCTPPETHKEIVCHLAKSGRVRAIWCEKPIALTIEDADEMEVECVANGVMLVVNHQRNWMHPKIKISRGVINTGTHMFALLNSIFGPIQVRDLNTLCTGGILMDLEIQNIEKPVFELDFTHNKDRMLPSVLSDICSHLDAGHKSHWSFSNARSALETALKYEELQASDN